MKATLKTSIAAVLLGAATLAVAQSPAESFADRIKQFQALSGSGPAWKPQPMFSHEPRARTRLSIEDFQARSSDSPAFAAADNVIVNNQAIARTRPTFNGYGRPNAPQAN